MNPPEGMVVDHKNHNPLDNRRCNLRVCTQSQNGMNARVSKNNRSGSKWVFWSKQKKCWMVKVRVQDKMIRRLFKSRELADKEALRLALEHHGEFFCNKVAG